MFSDTSTDSVPASLACTPRVCARVGLGPGAAAAALGISPQALREWEKKACVARCPDCRKILAEDTRALIDDARDPQYRARTRGARTESLPDVAAAPREKQRPDVAASLNASRALSEHYKSQLMRLKLDLAEGRILPRADVERVWYEETRRVRDRILSLPSSLAGSALSAPDFRGAEEAIRAALEAALLALADEPTGPPREQQLPTAVQAEP